MRRSLLASLGVMASAAALLAGPKFVSVWKAPDAGALNYVGKKVVALVITNDQSLQMSGEEALVRALATHGATAIPAYRIVPREELHTAEKAKGWLERAGIEGGVALRPVRYDREKIYSPSIWTTSNYQTFWGYYGYGWSGVYIPGSSKEETTVVVETLVFSVSRDKLLWAGTAETKDPDRLQDFVKDVVDEAADEMKKMKLVR
jgi:hypothetical protein